MTTQVNAPIDWRNPPPPTPDDRRIRLHELLDRTGFKSHRSIYDRIARGQPLPEGTCHNRDICESYARENRDGLLLEALVNDSRVLACLARGDISQLSIEWHRVFHDVVDTVEEKMR